MAETCTENSITFKNESFKSNLQKFFRSARLLLTKGSHLNEIS